jgi:hypothetical protein
MNADGTAMRPAYPGTLAQWRAKGGNAYGYVEAALERIGDLWFASSEDGYREDLLRRMSPGQVAVWSTWQCSGEILNGGFSQLFYNSNGALVHEAIAGFRRLGAKDYAALFERACAVFPEGKVPKDRAARWMALAPSFAGEAAPRDLRDHTLYQHIAEKHEKSWGSLDSALCKLVGNEYFNSNLDKIQSAYVDANPQEFFITTTPGA